MTTATKRVLTPDAPQAWVGCLACYNAGRLVGFWVDGDEAGDVTTEELHEREFTPEKFAALKADLYECWPHEELWVFDHQDFQGFLSGECSPVEAQRAAEFAAKLDDEGLPVAAFVKWKDYGYASDDLDDDLVEKFRDAYHGEWESGADFAEDWFTETGQFDEDSPLASYVDWQRVWTGEFDCAGWTAEEVPGSFRVYILNTNA